MSTINLSHIAKLSKLTLSEAELNKFSSQLEETVEYVQNLQELPTEIVIPTSSPVGGVNTFFDDGAENTRKFAASTYIVSRIM